MEEDGIVKFPPMWTPDSRRVAGEILAMKVLITDQVEDACVATLSAEGLEVVLRPGISESELFSIVSEYDALIVRSSTKVSGQVIAYAHKLRVIGRAGAGVDNVDVDAATRRGIIVMNTPGGSTVSTAEHTIALLLALARHIPQANSSLKLGKWEREKFVGVELSGKTIGIIGLGKIGREVAKRCQGFGMKVIGYDPILSTEVAVKLGVELVDVDEIYPRSDFLTVHVPLTPETRKMIGEQELRRCKRGVHIINCARGGIIDEDALLKFLESGKVAGAALDVFTKEPPGNHPILQHESVIATPHLGASTEEAQEKVSVQIAVQVADALKGRGLSGVVNAVALQQAMREEIRPYVTLSEKMGSLQAQLMKGKLRYMTITCSGDLLQQSQQLLTAASLKGCLSHLLNEPVNYVNAPVIAKEMGVIVNERKEQESENYIHLLTLEFETDKEKRSFSGTVFAHANIRLVKIDGYYLEVKPEGYMLFYTNLDRPGMLARVGTVLASANINIAGVALGRVDAGSRALTIMSVDDDIPDAVLEEIRRIEGVFDAKVVSL